MTTDTYAYDDANRLTSVNGVTYTWDNNGNLLNDGVNAYTYDNANRLKTMTGPSVATSYSYNGLGDRLQEILNGQTTTFAMDYNTGLTQALSDGTNTYIYGNERLAQVNTGTEYFLGDALGSVRQLTNSNGAVTYDPYGVVTQTYGASQTAYGFTGEYTSQGFVYLRARMYSPASGRFTTRDSWQGDYNRPLSLNRWMYVEGNPVRFADHSGLFPEAMVIKNLPNFMYENPFDPPFVKERWGFYKLLLDAQEFDYVRLGFLDLSRIPYPVIDYSATTQIRLINCDTIMIGSQILQQYYENEVKRQRHPGIWWRDTSARYYDLFRPSGYPEYYPKTYVDGSYRHVSDYPNYHSVSIGLGVSEFNIIVDMNGYFHLSFPIPRAGGGRVFGLGYTESYSCGWANSFCYESSSPSEITEAIDGICAGGGLTFIGGIWIAPICWSPVGPSNVSAVATYYVGLEVGASGGASATLPLSPWLIAPNPKLGWRKALNDQLNGITLVDIISR